MMLGDSWPGTDRIKKTKPCKFKSSTLKNISGKVNIMKGADFKK